MIEPILARMKKNREYDEHLLKTVMTRKSSSITERRNCRNKRTRIIRGGAVLGITATSKITESKLLQHVVCDLGIGLSCTISKVSHGKLMAADNVGMWTLFVDC